MLQTDLLFSLDASWIVLVLFIGLLMVSELGFRIGRKTSLLYNLTLEPQLQAMEAAMLTLLALILGFTFSMAATRLDARRQIVVDEANAIGTAYLRSDLMADPSARSNYQRALKGFLAERIEIYQAPNTDPRLLEFEKRADAAQNLAWNMAVAQAREKPTPISALIVSAVNEMIDARGRQVKVFADRVPKQIVNFLFMLSLIVFGVVGYVNGIKDDRSIAITCLFAGAIVLTVFIVLDLDRPRRGLIQIEPTSLIQLQAGIRA